ncbi:GPI inositol-deacylase [Photobacterium sp. SDRW27]|uniref:esterase/lipase family protein n=1 Tax=Photobacterium obscurum TaxID=2829490 RepID=UPI002243DF42|nr:alpha/beta hydrolase [Photobacterium obscurum]MCW8330262.1 GPI inositol-deacylase [Photobacterium obscurum]
MSKLAPSRGLKHLRISDLRGVVQLTTQATMSVTKITEGVHQSVWSTLGIPGGNEPGQTRGLTGLVYKSIYAITQLVGTGADKLLEKQLPLLAFLDENKVDTPERRAVLSALNGVMGDQLAANNNQFATSMTFYYQQNALNWPDLTIKPEVTGKVLLMIHGLCMNDRQWCCKHDDGEVDHGQMLSSELGYTPIYLRYNSGLHISQNGRELAAQLELLVENWPTPIEELAVVAHSMGGLVTRSAVHYGKQEALRWPSLMKNIVFLGTPHHGAPLERAGNKLDVILGSTPYTAPFTKLSKLRSSGITDLRYGHVVDEDWQEADRFECRPDGRYAVPLPEGIACYTVAATTASQRGLLVDRLVGDGLVPLRSALGFHDSDEHNLVFSESSQHIFYQMNHMELLSSRNVTHQILKWLSP